LENNELEKKGEKEVTVSGARFSTYRMPA
jgi:hypothetical protein